MLENESRERKTITERETGGKVRKRPMKMEREREDRLIYNLENNFVVQVAKV